MIVIDIGNSNVVIGIYKSQKILKSLRINTNNFNFNKKNKLIFNNIIKKYKFLSKNRLIVLGSVVTKKNLISALLALLWEQCSRCSSVLRYIDV